MICVTPETALADWQWDERSGWVSICLSVRGWPWYILCPRISSNLKPLGIYLLLLTFDSEVSADSVMSASPLAPFVSICFYAWNTYLSLTLIRPKAGTSELR